MTNHNLRSSNPHQSKLPNQNLTLKGDSSFELIESKSCNQKMLHEKMMMDPAISLVLFNEYIPLRQRPNEESYRNSNNTNNNNNKKEPITEATEKMSGLFLGKCEVEEVSNEQSKGLFIRSEISNSPPSTTAGQGLFIRSENANESSKTGESSSDPMCTTDDWVIA